MANRNGLNHKVRSFKGVGWNRALPAPFGFGNGLWPDGSNDYLTVPKLVGKIIPDQFTIEYWTKFPDPVNDIAGLFRFYSYGGGTIMIARTAQPLNLQISIAEQGPADVCTLPSDTRRIMVAHSVDMLAGKASFYSPNNPVSIRTGYSALIPKAGTAIEKFEFFTAGNFTVARSNAGLDEFRFYRSLITQEQFDTNYNAGIGNNPFETENLLIWFKFERFEMLDFSDLQDGSDIRLGVRDHSGNNYHAQPFSMDTNPASPNYVIKPF